MDEPSNPIVMEEIKGEVPHSRVRVRMRVKWRRKRGGDGLGMDKRPDKCLNVRIFIYVFHVLCTYFHWIHTHFVLNLVLFSP